MKKLVTLLALAAILGGMLFSPFAAPAVSAASCGDTYTVQKGDYLTKIAQTCGVSYDTIIKANPEIKNPNLIYTGQVIRLKVSASVTPVPTSTPSSSGGVYTVVRGDYLSKIAAAFGTTTTELLKLNPEITNPSLIYVGQKIKLPGSTTSSSGSTSNAFVTLSSSSVARGATFDVTVQGFPANADIDFRLGKDGSAYSVVMDGKTDASGKATAKMTMPNSAVVGDKWVVVILTTDLVSGKETKSPLITVK